MKPANIERLRHTGLLVDLFAGGGGASIGIEAAFGRPLDIALNHDPFALALHAANHPRTVHHCQAIEDADPAEIIGDREVFYLHASPSCTQFSRSRRAIPAERQQRDHAWRVLDWIKHCHPVLFTCENVAEFMKWGPLDAYGFPDKSREGLHFVEWTRQIRSLGYAIEWRVINAADLGAHTARERLMIVARRDGLPVEWPQADHGPEKPNPWKAAGDHIDWCVETPSIFTPGRKLAENTLNRIRKGIEKFVFSASSPFIAPEWTNTKGATASADKVAAFLAQNHSSLAGRSLEQPLSTICSKAAGQSLVTLSFLDIARQNTKGADLRAPTHTICASGNHHAEVRISAMHTEKSARFIGDGQPQLMISGREHVLVDIGYRFLTADELWALQGFDVSRLKRNVIVKGRPLTASRQKKMIGNSVVPLFAERIVAANLEPIDRLALAKAA